MDFSLRDQFNKKINNAIKKHARFEIPILVYKWFIIGIFDVVCFFLRNGKKFSCACAVVIIFSVSTSFSFEEQISLDETLGENEQWNTVQENYEYEPVAININASELIDDDDVINGYDNDELDVSEKIDQFSIDDILELNKENHLGVVQSNEEQLSKDDWQLVLVNKQHPVPKDYSFTLGKITGNMECDVRIIDELLAMLQAAKKDGVELVICSPYRDYQRQTVLFNRKIDYYMNKGYSYMEAYKISSITVTVPGASEHQIGLALDIVSDTYSSLDTGFGETKAGKWLKTHGCEYGFILRYPLGKEYITGIQYEPWHFRYVGKNAATSIMKRGITLEEFLEDLD